MGFIAHIGLMLALGTFLGFSAHVYWQGSRQLMPATGGVALLAAYVFAISCNACVPLAVSIFFAVLAGILLGLLLSLVGRGLSRAEFMLLGLALVEIIHRGGYILPSLTGGADGLSVTGTSWVTPMAGALVAVVAALLVILAAVIAWRSSHGAVLRLTGASPRCASVLGVNTNRYELWCAGVGGVLSAIAGVLYALTIQYIHPDDFGMTLGLPALAVGLAVRPHRVVLDVPVLTLGLFGLREVLRYAGTGSTRFAFHDLAIGVILIAVAIHLGRLTDREDEHLWERP